MASGSSKSTDKQQHVPATQEIQMNIMEPEAFQVSSLGGIEMHDSPSSSVTSDGNTQSHARGQSDSTADQSVHDLSVVHDSPSSPLSRLASSLGPVSSADGPLVVQQCYELRYSPPTASAVSSSLDSPVTPSFQRSRHPRAQSSGDWWSSPEEDTPKLLREVIDYGYEATAVGGQQLDQNLGISDGFSFPDDAEDMMNLPIEAGEGFVVPRVAGVTSISSEDLSNLTEAHIGLPHEDIPSSPRSFSRRASSPTGRPMSHFASPSAFRDSESGHVQFTPKSVTEETPFANTLKYFKQFKGKENTPSKSRRNASLPEEIAEVAKEAQQEGIDDEDEVWDKYREMDLVPMDPVMDDGIAGDLITGTPIRKAKAVTTEGIQPMNWGEVLRSEAETSGNEPISTRFSLGDGIHNAAPLYQVDLPGHFGDTFRLRFRSGASTGDMASFLRERGEALEADQGDIDNVIEEFLRNPTKFEILESSDSESFRDESYFDTDSQDNEQTPGGGTNSGGEKVCGVIRTDRACEESMNLRHEDPVFIKVIGMLPEAMFWAVMQPVAYCSTTAFKATGDAIEKVSRKLVALSLGVPLTS